MRWQLPRKHPHTRRTRRSRPDSQTVNAAAAEGAAEGEIGAGSAITSEAAASADEADDLAGVADEQAAGTDEATAG